MDQTLPLDTPTQPNPPPRPSSHDTKIIAAGVKALMPEIIEWLEDDYRPAERERMEQQIVEAIENSHSLDGYDLARALDWLGADAALVEILDSATSCIYGARDEAVLAWVAANGIKPKFAVGDTVSAGHRCKGPAKIVEIRAASAEYVLQDEEWVTQRPTQTRGGYIVAYEHVWRI